MSQKNQQLMNQIVRHLTTKKWTKKNMLSLAGIVAIGVAGKYIGFGGGDAPSGSIKKGSTYAAKVIKVADGDTATVVDTHGAQHKIRFAYIDAPETKQANGIASKNALTQLIDGKQVQIYVTDIDRYQRQVSVVSVNNLDVNYEQVKQGHAWHYQSYAKKNQNPSDYQKYDAAQQAAKSQRVGLWSGKKPQAPWDYRAELRAAKNGNGQNTSAQNTDDEE